MLKLQLMCSPLNPPIYYNGQNYLILVMIIMIGTTTEQNIIRSFSTTFVFINKASLQSMVMIV
jgi:hypothetical protein